MGTAIKGGNITLNVNYPQWIFLMAAKTVYLLDFIIKKHRNFSTLACIKRADRYWRLGIYI